VVRADLESVIFFASFSTSSLTMPDLKLRRQTKTVQRFIEPLLQLEPDALPLAIIWIPGGEFMMGSPGEAGDFDDEKPQHRVQVPSFAMGQYPVTQAQWRAVAQLPQQTQELDPDPSNFKGANHPVEQVSWDDATEFCARLAAHTGRAYRLPTEAEWEYACRAGTTTPFHFGETLSPEVANYDCSVTYGDRGVTGSQIGQTTPVDKYAIANRFGLSDMHGNVWEWCEDDWHNSYEGAPTDGSAWLESGNENSTKVIRGGSWVSDPRNCRSAYRDGNSRDDRNTNLGFRVACAAPRLS
jgi:formylglycine-generating enzyme required for sulfatase activity